MEYGDQKIGSEVIVRPFDHWLTSICNRCVCGSLAKLCVRTNKPFVLGEIGIGVFVLFLTFQWGMYSQFHRPLLRS